MATSKECCLLPYVKIPHPPLRRGLLYTPLIETFPQKISDYNISCRGLSVGILGKDIAPILIYKSLSPRQIGISYARYEFKISCETISTMA